MTATLVPFDDRQGWLAARRQGIGSSDIAAIVGASKWATPFQVYVSKVDDVPDDEGSEAMRWGTMLETLILDDWEANHVPVPVRGVMLRSTERPFMIATPDGMTEAGEPVEAKNSADWTWAEIPEMYRLQVQWQLAVSGAERAFMAVLHGGRQAASYTVPRDEALIAHLVDAATDFWGLVERRELPAVDADDNAVLASLFPRHVEKAIEVDAALADELRAAREAHRAATARRDVAEAALKVALGEADTAVVGQDVVATWRTQESRRLDAARLRAERPEVAAEYENVSTSRVLRVRGES